MKRKWEKSNILENSMIKFVRKDKMEKQYDKNYRKKDLEIERLYVQIERKRYRE